MNKCTLLEEYSVTLGNQSLLPLLLANVLTSAAVNESCFSVRCFHMQLNSPAVINCSEAVSYLFHIAISLTLKSHFGVLLRKKFP